MGTPFSFFRTSSIVRLPSQVVAYYKLNEASGSIGYDVISLYNLTQTGTVGTTTGKFSGARGVFGNSTYLGRTETAFNPTLMATSFWFKTSSSGNIEAIIGNQGDSKGQEVYKLADDKIAWQQNGTSPYLTSTATYADSAWHHCFIGNRATSGSNERRLYIDGSIVAQGDGVTIASATYPYYIGVNPVGGNGFASGYVDDVVFFDLTGTPYTWAEIEAKIINPIYANGAGRTWTPDNYISAPAQITEFWRMDEASGGCTGGKGAYDLTEVGTVARTAGVIGNAIQSSNNNYMTANAAIGGTATYMIEFWYKQTVDANYYLINKYDGASNGWWVRQYNNHISADGYGATTLTSTNDTRDSTWHYYVIARRATSGANESRLYLDGVLNAQGAGASNTVSAASTMFIGADLNGATSTNDLDEVAFWGDISALSWATIEGYIAKRYNAGLGRQYKA